MKSPRPRFVTLMALLAASGSGTVALAAPPAATGTCRFLSADDVGKALHVAIVRVEPGEGDTSGCEYSIKGKPSSAAADHGIAMGGAMNGQTLDPASQKMMEGLSSLMMGSEDADTKKFRHAGEVVALMVAVESGDATQMQLSRQSMGYPMPVTPISGLGDEAFSNSNSMMFVRKGDKVLRFFYTGCPCATKDVVPLARQILAAI